MNIRRISPLCVFLVAFALLFPGAAQADDAPMSAIPQKVANLTRLQDAMDNLSRDIVDTRRKLESPEGQGREKILEDRLVSLNQKLFDLEQSFNDLASETRFDGAALSQGMDFDWGRELKEILGPLIRELQQATERPRTIEKYRSEIQADNQQLDSVQNAMAHIKQLMAAPSCPPRLHERLKQTLAMWESRLNEIETRRNITQLQLDRISGESESLAQSIQNIPQMFFKSHGSNLLIASAVFFLTIFGLLRLGRLFRIFAPLKNKSSLRVRAFHLGYIAFSIIMSLVILLSVVYLLSDWVLLSLVLVFLIGLAWTSKETLPRVWNQCRLILNLGPVREGELVVFNGIPYRVMAINIHTLIYNPDIPSSRIRLPVADLLDMRSRPVDPGEPWFPSRIGDWVMIGDGYPVKVLSQTPETVIVERIGGARVSFPALDFMAASPVNLSSGFRLKVLFGLDYALQPMITKSVPAIIEKAVESHLVASGFKEQILQVWAEFAQAGSSTLDIEIAIDFKGPAAKDFARIHRLVQRACVETCNAENWSIPFNQLTVHMAPTQHS